MINNTKIKVSKKVESMLDDISKDSDGYWASSKDGFYFTMMDCHTAHEDTQKELLSVIRTLAPCNCNECTGPLDVEVKDLLYKSSEV